MEVSHREDLVTHAVITTNEAQGFGMSDSAEFFNILSSTLYQNQHLAVIRETLCNAWDAHIDAGITHKPVEVTLTADRLIIRDFGKGIPDNKMRDIYCVYGQSTKTHDGKQTGGFGLGCKAPFAYVDHFEVISMHAGVKTIYNMSKSNAQAGGKPGMIKLASMPTDETGLQVSIDVKNTIDHTKFRELIKEVTFRGDLGIAFNGHKLDILGFNPLKSNFMIVPGNTLGKSNTTSVFVRYGNVIYPVGNADGINPLHSKITNILAGLSSKHEWKSDIVFQAPPHSISVQPSREGLSMKEHTINTLKGLMEGFIKEVDQGFLQTCLKLRQKEIEELVLKKDMVTLLNAQNDKYSHNGVSVPERYEFIQTVQQMAERAMVVNPPKIPGYEEKDLALRIQMMANHKLLDRGLASTFLRDLAEQVKDARHSSEWLMRRVLAPMTLKLKEAGLDTNAFYVKHRYSSKDNVWDTVTNATLYRETRLVNVAPFLRNIVVVTHKMTGLERRLGKHQDMKGKGTLTRVLVYYCGTSKASKAQALAHFRSQPGLHVIDLTVMQAWEALEKPEPKPKKPKKIGLPKLSCVVTEKGGVNLRRIMLDDAERIEQPEFVGLVSFDRHSSSEYLNHWRFCMHLLLDLYGDRGALINHSGRYETALKAGAKDLDAFVLDEIKQVMTTNKTLKKHLASLPWRLLPDDTTRQQHMRELYEHACKVPALQKKFNLPKPLEGFEAKIMQLWDGVKRHYSHIYSQPSQVQEIDAFIESVPVNTLAVNMLENFNQNPLSGVIDRSGLNTKLRLVKAGTSEAKHLNTVLQLLFNP